MKLFQKKRIRLRLTRLAFTLPEIMITSVIFVTVVVLGMVVLQLFSIRAYQLSGTKLMATADSLRTMSQIRDQIRGAAELQVGNFTSNTSTFTPIAYGTNQVGSAVKVFTSTNTTYYTIFYRESADPNAPNLYMYAVDTNGNASTRLLASWVSNTNCFQAEDQTGSVLTTTNNDAAIHMTLQFYEKEYDMTANNNTNFYYLETRATPRAPNVVNN